MKTPILTISFGIFLAMAQGPDNPEGPSFMHPEPMPGIVCWSEVLTITYADGFLSTTVIPPPPPPPPSPTTISRGILTLPSFPPHFETTTQVKMAPGLGNQAIDTPDPTSPIPATPPAQPEPTPAPEAGKLRKRKHSHKHKGKKLNRFTCTYATSMIEWLTHFNTPKWLPSSGTITGSINMFITTTALSTTETGYFLGGQALMPQNNLHGQPGKLGEQEVNAESSDDEYEDDEDEDECGDVGEAENVTETATVTVTITTIATILETSTVTETETEGKPSEAN